MADTVEAARGGATRRRLRRLIREIEGRPPPALRRAVAAPAPSLDARPLDSPLPDSFPPDIRRRETAAGPCSFREIHYPLSHQVGAQPLADLAHARTDALSLLAPDEHLRDVEPAELLFLDIETSGLGGAGAMTFLVATGRVEGDEFVLRQYLALSPAEEAALLEALLEDTRIAELDPVLATYNGRRFDAPLLDERATMHRRRAGFDSLRQLDLLLPVRTAFRGLLASCRLAVVEAELLGLSRPPGEVPGAEAPAWYFRYLRSGDAACLLPLIAHNELDVVSLAALAGRLAAVLDGAREAAGRDALAIGRLLMARRHHRAAACLDRVLCDLGPSHDRDEALSRRAVLHKRAGRHDLARPLWEELAVRREPGALRALVELAMYHEHQLRDFARASALVKRALSVVDAAFPAWEAQRAASWRERLLHRHARIAGKAARRRPARLSSEERRRR